MKCKCLESEIIMIGLWIQKKSFIVYFALFSIFLRNGFPFCEKKTAADMNEWRRIFPL